MKLSILAFFIVVAFGAAFNMDNLEPFAPDGVDGVVTAASVIFFAYIGFDAVSTGAEEAREPKRDLPLAIVGSLVICTIIYILVSIAAVGSLDAEALSGVRRPAGRGARRRRRHQLGRQPGGLRRAGGDHQRDDHDLLRPDAHLLRDGARRPDAAPGSRRSTRAPARRCG